MAIPNLSDMPEVALAPKGEYAMTVKKCEEKRFGSGNMGLSVILAFEEEEGVFRDDIFLSLVYPDPASAVKTQIFNAERLKNFAAACGIDPEGAEAEDFIGCEVTASVIIKAGKDQNGNATGERNEIAGFVVG